MRRSHDEPVLDVEQPHASRDDAPDQASDKARDGGFSFIEIVVTVVLMGVVLLPILAAVRTGVQTSVSSKMAAEVETALVNAVDRVYRADRSGAFACDVTSPVAASIEAFGWDPATSVIVGHEYLDNGVWVTDGTGTACPGGVFQAGLVQRVTITVISPDGAVSRTLEVVRGDV
jgi:type II secretory pathway pseudopilin PulG